MAALAPEARELLAITGALYAAGIARGAVIARRRARRGFFRQVLIADRVEAALAHAANMVADGPLDPQRGPFR